MSTPVVVITGASRGIGASLLQLYSPTCTAIGTSRAAPAGLISLDVRSDDDCSSLLAKLQAKGITRVDLLINNAGVLIKDDGDLDAVRAQWEINALGPLKVTKALMPLLKASPNGKVVNMSSRMGSIGDNTSGSYYGYRASKAALNQFGVTLARDLAKDGIVVLTVHPGNVKTDMNPHGDVEPDECAKRLGQLIASKNKVEDGFKFWHRDGTELPW